MTRLLATCLLCLSLVAAPAAPAADLSAVQSALSERGYSPGPSDGVMGQRTQRALRRFQADHGLAVTGTATDETLLTLGLSEEAAMDPDAATNLPEVPFYPDLRDVFRLFADLEAALDARGYDVGPIDGKLQGDGMERYAADTGIDRGDGPAIAQSLGVDYWTGCFWIDRELKCPIGCSAPVVMTHSTGTPGYIVQCPGHADTLIPFP